MVSYEQRKKYKEEPNFKKTNKIWGAKHLNRVSSVGCVNKSFKDFYNENRENFDNITADDFAEYYFKNTKSKKELREVGLKLQKACAEENIFLCDSSAFYYTIIRVIDETWDGFQRELRMIKYLKKKYPGATVIFTDSEDCDFCVDLKVCYGDIVVEYFQVKPISFYKGLVNNSYNCVNAYIYNTKKHDELKAATGKYAMYLIENENGENIIERYDLLIKNILSA